MRVPVRLVGGPRHGEELEVDARLALEYPRRFRLPVIRPAELVVDEWPACLAAAFDVAEYVVDAYPCPPEAMPARLTARYVVPS